MDPWATVQFALISAGTRSVAAPKPCCRPLTVYPRSSLEAVLEFPLADTDNCSLICPTPGASQEVSVPETAGDVRPLSYAVADTVVVCRIAFVNVPAGTSTDSTATFAMLCVRFRVTGFPPESVPKGRFVAEREDTGPTCTGKSSST